MGILDRYRGRSRSSIPPSATFRLTEQGRDKLQDFGGDPKSRILMALETQGTSDLAEISRSSNLNRGEIERMIPGMVRGGYIAYVGAAQSEDM
uniref:Putative DNA binding, helix-turn-helix domain containing protein n=1 Tax=viral metagenome TaxID=1070528 RepID=A0A6H1ZZD5_9ZZZZ